MDGRSGPGPVPTHATATLLAAKSRAVQAVLAVEAAVGPADVGVWISGLARSGLTPVTNAADVPSRPGGWRVLVLFPGLDRIAVHVHSPASMTFYAGMCAVTDGRRELVAETGGCVLLAGRLGLDDVPRADLTPRRVAELVDAAGDAGLLAGGLIPVFWPSGGPGRGTGFSPGFARPGGRQLFPGHPVGGHRDIPLFPLEPPDDDEACEPDVSADHVDEALKAVRPAVRGMSRQQVRERLVSELLDRGKMLPSRAVDRYADDIWLGGDTWGKARRWMRRSAAAAKAGWHALRTAEAVVLHRPVPHWQLWGIPILLSLRCDAKDGRVCRGIA